MPAQAASLAEYVDAFEEARARGDGVALDAFLPPVNHPLRTAVLRELVCIDLEHRWLKGQPRPIDDYRRRYPELFADQVAVREVLFEEYRLRQQAIEEGWLPVGPPSTLPSFRHSAGGPARPDEGTFPAAGDTFEGFRLVRELGRGTFARVFLAEQSGLANRPVVLKIAPCLFDESQTLAQLQHSHIVPIYSAHVSRSPRFQALCMPCLGVVTLADILQQLRSGAGCPSHGHDILALARRARAAKGAGASAPLDVPSGQSWNPLRDGSYLEAVLWLGACLADGLAHAHQRGVLHRDLKPANVLLTDDGRPLLLDFNLAEDVKQRSGPGASGIGGTLPYMPPEQLEAFVGEPRQLDGRTDVFALGAVLFELLTGQPPCAVAPGPTEEVVARLLRQRRRGPVDPGWYNADLSPAVRAIIRRCLEPDPADRYATAGQLQEDLERQLAHEPLQHTPEPSLAERVGKWLYRHPRFVSSGSLSLVALVAVVLLSSLAAARTGQLARAEAHDHALRFRQEARQLSLLCLAGQPGDPAHLEKCEQRCGQLLEPYLPRPTGGGLALLPEPARREVRDEVGYLLLLWARVRGLRGEAGLDARTCLRDALELNRQAEAFFDAPPLALLRQRAGLYSALGEREAAREVQQVVDRVVPHDPRDLALLAAGKRHEGKPAEAKALLERGLAVNPGDFCLWYDLGLCQEQLGDDGSATSSYSTCLALAPEAVPARFRRGLAYLRLHNHAAALDDLDRVVSAEPDLVEARINRALARAGTGRARAALADLDSVLAGPAPYTRVWFLRSELRRQEGDTAGAERDLAEGLRRRPSDELSWVARAGARLATPIEALADLERALALNPLSRPALQNKAHVLADRLNRPSEAIAALDRLLALWPGDVEARAARGVLHARLGRREAARADATASLSGTPRKEVLYRVACVHALLSRDSDADRQEALTYLQCALGLGQSPRLLAADRDLDPLRGDPGFQRLLSAQVRRGSVP